MALVSQGAGQAVRERTARVLSYLNRPGVLAAALLLATVLAGLATYAIVSGTGPRPASAGTILILLLLDLALVLTLAAMIAWRLVRLWAARRSQVAGARLHARLVAMFSAVAVVPAIIVAVFAAFSLNLGIEAWFSERVSTALDRAQTVATSYLAEHKEAIRADVYDMAVDINRAIVLLETDQANLVRNLVYQAQQRSLSGAILFDEQGHEVARALEGFLISVEPPTPEEFDRARRGEVVILTDADDNQVKALVRIEGILARFLLVTRYVDATILERVSEMSDAVNEYSRLEENRTAIQMAFGLIYAGVALVILLAAILLGLWAANRLVQPIGRLIGAAERISDGDLSARVTVEKGDDEVATLGRVFNRMTAQLQSQRDALIEANRVFDQRRRFTEAVLSGVSAGVLGLDGAGHVNAANRSAMALLDRTRDELMGHHLTQAVPEMAGLLEAAHTAPGGRVQGQVDVEHDGQTRSFSVRVTGETGDNEHRGFVVTFDDITELVVAQRTAAWADVARRIAHEIKNPLTPIQLSAERLRRKYTKEIATDPEVFEQCTQTIIRQVSDIGRMVDEFSSFARMPAPVMRHEDLAEILRQAVFLQRVGNAAITYDLRLPEGPVAVECDGRLVGQALTNVLKNAAEAVRARAAADEDSAGHGTIDIEMTLGEAITITVTDNGVGLPREDRNRLTEPYVTTRSKGTGLGLAIVKKIMEDHGGTLHLEDAPATDRQGQPRDTGARVTLVFPMSMQVDGPGVTEHVEERAAQSA